MRPGLGVRAAKGPSPTLQLVPVQLERVDTHMAETKRGMCCMLQHMPPASAASAVGLGRPARVTTWSLTGSLHQTSVSTHGGTDDPQRSNSSRVEETERSIYLRLR